MHRLPLTEIAGRSRTHSTTRLLQLINPGTKSPLVVTPGSSFSNVKGIVSYAAANEPYAPPVSSPKTIYSALTGLFQDGAPTEADYRVARGQSIIDLVSDDLNSFKSEHVVGRPPEDRRLAQSYCSRRSSRSSQRRATKTPRGPS